MQKYERGVQGEQNVVMPLNVLPSNTRVLKNAKTIGTVAKRRFVTTYLRFVMLRRERIAE